VLGERLVNFIPPEQNLGEAFAIGQLPETLLERLGAVLHIPLVDGVLQMRFAILGVGVEGLDVVEDVDLQ